MRACIIKQTTSGISIQPDKGEAVSINADALRMIQQRQVKHRLVPLEHNFGQPIKRQGTK